ncbi:MAG TPA: DUF2238 domain-containing protein [Dokdonella sp.]|nr:DUF2238 domain-containing protein [Dokdonella sp.]
MMTQPARRHVPAILLALFIGLSVVLGIAPATREDWLLENVLVVLALAWLVHSYRRLPLSDAAYACLFVFGVLHEIGAHYQYSAVPYEAWFAAISGGGSLDAMFGFERNQYDRLVHFLYGVLVTPAAVEVIEARVRPRGVWRFLVPFTFMASHALAYELFEWLAASLFGGDLGEAYLGTQGDAWDAHKDMALAVLGNALVLPVWLRRMRIR